MKKRVSKPSGWLHSRILATQQISEGSRSSTTTKIDRTKLKCNAEHLNMLMLGREKWNEWRLNNPKIKPDLKGVNFADIKIWKDTPLWVDENDDPMLPPAHVNFYGQKNNLFDLTEVDFTGSTFDYTRFRFVNLSGADFSFCRLRESNISYTDLTDSIFHGADLRAAAFENCDIRGVIWRYTRLADAVFNDNNYTRNALVRRCYGAAGMNEIRGDAIFRRDLRDQAYIDSMDRLWEHRFSSPRQVLFALLGGFFSERLPFLRLFPIFVALILTMLFTAVLGIVTIGPQGIIIQASTVALIFSVFYAFTGLAQSLVGGYTGNRLWAVFRHGRDWDRVIWFGLFLIVVAGGLFNLGTPEHLCLKIEALNLDQCGSDGMGGAAKTWVPFFAAAMGFLTLGILEIMEPRTLIGGFLMVLNVLSGFLTLGLLLSVLSDRFSRRE